MAARAPLLPTALPAAGGALALAFALAGCGDLFNLTTSATDSTGESDTQDATTGDPQECGDPPAAPACTPPSTSSLGSLCGARSNQGDCLAYGDGVTSKCAWVNVATLAASATECNSNTTAGVCIGLQASGAGCNEATCAGTIAATTYYRYNAQCAVELFQGSFCGFQVVDWSACAWSGTGTETCTVPWPSGGPPVCKCAC